MQKFETFKELIYIILILIIMLLCTIALMRCDANPAFAAYPGPEITTTPTRTDRPTPTNFYQWTFTPEPYPATTESAAYPGIIETPSQIGITEFKAKSTNWSLVFILVAFTGILLLCIFAYFYRLYNGKDK